MDDDYKFKFIRINIRWCNRRNYDKVARVLHMPYPGGPNVEKLALLGQPTYELSKPMREMVVIILALVG